MNPRNEYECALKLSRTAETDGNRAAVLTAEESCGVACTEYGVSYICNQDEKNKTKTSKESLARAAENPELSGKSSLHIWRVAVGDPQKRSNWEDFVGWRFLAVDGRCPARGHVTVESAPIIRSP